jgi:hypothetical protein
MRLRGKSDVSATYRAEQGHGADCLQRPLVPRSRFRQRLMPGVRHLSSGCLHQRAEGVVYLSHNSDL